MIERGGRFTIAECKLAENPDANATAGLTAFAAMYGEDVVDDAMVVCRPGRPYGLGQGSKTRVVGISELIKAISR